MRGLILLTRCALGIGLLLMPAGVMAQATKTEGTLTDEHNNAIGYANVVCLNSDSTSVGGCVSDDSGHILIKTDTTVCAIRISKVGYVTKTFQRPFPSRFILAADGQLLDEVTVTGKAALIKQTDTGLVYEMSRNKYAKAQNLLEAMRFVPMLYVSSDGELSVIGHNDYQIYLNGKRYDIAEANAKQTLQSLPAHIVKHIEVITTEDKRFHSEGTVVINIVTEKKLLDGFSFNASANGTTQPTAKAGVSMLGKKGNVDFSLAYNYDLDTQRKQPITQDITYTDRTIDLDGKGDGDWHNHLLRGMMSWEIDSLNTIYADIHAKILRTDFKTVWQQTTYQGGGVQDNSEFENRNHNTSGTIESNVIYRNYYRHAPQQEKLTLGYRYTYNPDHRNFSQVWQDDASTLQDHNIKTDGGLHEHIANAAYSVLMGKSHKGTFGAKAIWRNGNTTSTDHSDMSYHQELLYPYIKFTGNVAKFYYSLNLSGEYDHLKMETPYAEMARHSNTKLYFTPSLMLARNFSGMQVSLNYDRTTTRPTIVMLNPFYSLQNGYAASVGNPYLGAETKNSLSLNMSKFKSRLFYTVGVTYTYTDNAIVFHQQEDEESGIMLSTYDNIGNVTTLTGNIFVNWQPITPLVIKFNINGG